MFRQTVSRLLICGGSALLLFGVGFQCGSLQAAEAIAVSVARPVAREVTDRLDFTGRAEAVQSVNLVPRVTGYVVNEPFKEGSEVKAGDLLFEIDSRPYQDQYDTDMSQVALHKAQLALAQATLARDEQLARVTPASVPTRQLDLDRGALDEAKARVTAREGSVEASRHNLAFCRITAPIDGHVNRSYLSKGNLATQDTTVLTTIVSLDPMYVYFDVDEQTFLRLRKTIRVGQVKPAAGGNPSVFIELADEDGFPHKGQIDFINNQVNPSTGTILVRGIFPNPTLPEGYRLLIPGMFLRARLPIGSPRKALLVADAAIHSDRDAKFVYAVTAAGEIERKTVEIGSLEDDRLRVVTSGLTADDRVVVGKPPLLRAAMMKVEAKEVPMPARGGEAKKE